MIVELTPLRNDIAHKRELSFTDKKKLKEIIKDLEAYIIEERKELLVYFPIPLIIKLI